MMYDEEMNRIERRGVIQSTVQNSFKIATIAPPSSTRGGIDEKTGHNHNKLVQIKINNKNNDNGKNIFFLKRLR